MEILDIVLIVVLVVLFAVLVIGVVVMARGGEFAKKYSNKMMRYRVAIQFVAVLVIAAILFLRGQSSG